MGKIIIHNETKLKDLEALQYLEKAFNGLENMPTLSYCEFKDNTRVQIYHQKTCKTFYIYRLDNGR